jgi:flagellar assembly protein FliH
MIREGAAIIEAYYYPAGPEPSSPVWSGIADLNPEAVNEPAESAVAPTVIPEGRDIAHGQEEVEAKLRNRFEDGQQRGFEEGRKAEREVQNAAHLADERLRREQVAAQVQAFLVERDRYLEEVEHEVVQLALAVAARVLRREAQMDPLLLTGAVRVALGQLSKTTKVRLQVPAPELELWKDAISHIPNLPLKPDLTVGDDLRLGDCRIETELGSVDLGIRAQLGEIEHGFFDRARYASGHLSSPGAHSDEAEIRS